MRMKYEIKMSVIKTESEREREANLLMDAWFHVVPTVSLSDANAAASRVKFKSQNEKRTKKRTAQFARLVCLDFSPAKATTVAANVHG